MFVDCYIAVSYKLAERLKKNVISEDKVKVVRNAVNVKYFCHKNESDLSKSELKHSEDKRVALTVARIDKLKGHKYLIEAAPFVPDTVFLIAGDGPEKAVLEKKARDLKVADRVVFLGQRNDVPELLNACDFFVLPSLLEGLPLSVLEAMSASRPVIATDIDGINEIIIDGENGLLVPPADPKALAEKIKLLLSDKSLAARLAVSGKETIIRNFTLEKMVKEVTDIYCEIIRRKGITDS
jgi:glycosyltransferase involved in cell wall biosynthesis